MHRSVQFKFGPPGSWLCVLAKIADRCIIIFFFDKMFIERCIERLVDSPVTCRIVSVTYALLSLVGSILLLKYRLELVEDYNPDGLVSDKNMRIIVFVFGHFWLTSIVILLGGMLWGIATLIKIHLYFLNGVNVGFFATLLIGAVTFLGICVGEMDKARTPWTEMIFQSFKYTLAMALLLSLVALVSLCCILFIRLFLMNGFRMYKPFKPYYEELVKVAVLENAKKHKIVDADRPKDIEELKNADVNGDIRLTKEVKCDAYNN
uniref:(northern house mosquito) hypothetical protein n=2 Tax=Culex pipiens TaxID=7175 RepID=A0A8D8EWI7_CULPI